MLPRPPQKAKYIRNRRQHEAQYKKLVVDYLVEYKRASRQDIRELLYSILPELLTLHQKNKKVRNLLHRMKLEGTIVPVGVKAGALWKLTSDFDAALPSSQVSEL